MKDLDVGKIKDLSHNINTPLTTIMGYASLIAKISAEGTNAEKIQKWTESIRKEALKISRYSKKINSMATKHLPD